EGAELHQSPGLLVAGPRQRELPQPGLRLAGLQRHRADHLAVLVDLQGLLGLRISQPDTWAASVGRPPFPPVGAERPQRAVQPPSTKSELPVMNDDASEASSTTIPASSDR